MPIPIDLGGDPLEIISCAAANATKRLYPDMADRVDFRVALDLYIRFIVADCQIKALKAAFSKSVEDEPKLHIVNIRAEAAVNHAVSIGAMLEIEREALKSAIEQRFPR
jgi:hypothetical protein